LEKNWNIGIFKMDCENYLFRINEEKILKEGLEKLSERKDNGIRQGGGFLSLF
jgi:hypothetical protein